MSIERVKAYFEAENMADRVREFEVSSATVALAAQALGCEEGKIAKSLSFHGKDNPILVLTAGDARIDNPKYKRTFGCKAKMISFEEVEDLIGHPPGGVCPFAVKENVKVYLDESLKKYDTVFPACGSANSAIELSIPELEQYSHFTEWVDVCK